MQYKMLRMFVIVISLTIPQAFAQTTGEHWEQFSEDYKIGYVIGVMDMMRLPRKGDDRFNNRVTQMNVEFNECAIKRGLNGRQIRESIRGYIDAHQEDKSEPLIILTIAAMTKLCRQ